MIAPSDLTYAVQHNPRCAKPFLVRLPTIGYIDLLPYTDRPRRTKDALGFGMTFEEAFANALKAKSAANRATKGDETE